MTQSSSIETIRRAGELLAEAGNRTGRSLYIVGGVVRDLCLGEASCSDLDVVVVGDAIELGRHLSAATGGVLTEHGKFRTATITEVPELPAGCSIDLVTARSESYSTPGALPSVKPDSIEADLSRRDFTINTLSLPVELLAQLPAHTSERTAYVRAHSVGVEGALIDLDARLIRILHPRSFLDDPTRLFRAARYAARLSAKIEADTHARAAEAVASGALATISWHRILREIEFILLEESSSEAATILERWSVFGALAVPSFLNMRQRLAQVINAIEPVRWLQVWQYGAALGVRDAELSELTRRFGLGKKWLRQCEHARRALREGRIESLPVEGLLALVAFSDNSSQRAAAQQTLNLGLKEAEGDADEN